MDGYTPGGDARTEYGVRLPNGTEIWDAPSVQHRLGITVSTSDLANEHGRRAVQESWTMKLTALGIVWSSSLALRFLERETTTAVTATREVSS